MMIDITKIVKRFSLPRDGVVHIGANRGQELGMYQAIGFSSMLFIEANPALYPSLQEKMAGKPGIMTECIAITDKEGTSTFHVTDNDGQSSSVLALKKHLKLHPNVHEVGQITVNTITLDALIDQKYADRKFSFLNLDIQGAELLALKGAARLLGRISGINCEVNFDELYEGAPHISALDAYLSTHNFVRVETMSATKSWGDAIYVKNQYTKV